MSGVLLCCSGGARPRPEAARPELEAAPVSSTLSLEARVFFSASSHFTAGAVTQACKPESVKAPPNTAWEEWPPAAGSLYSPREATCPECSCRCDCAASWWQLRKRRLGGTGGVLGRQLDEASAGMKGSRAGSCLKRQNPGGCGPLEQECAPLT